MRINQPVAFDSLGRAWCGRIHAVHRNGEITVKVQLEAAPFLLVVSADRLRQVDADQWRKLPEPLKA